VARQGDMMKFEFVAFSQHAQTRPLDWPVPMADRMRTSSAGEFVWKRLQYVFRLPDPRSFAPSGLTLTDAESELLGRFVAQAETLAGTSLLSSDDVVSISIPDDDAGEEQIDSELAEPDVTSGFMVLLRQCYADGEEASFSKVRKVLERQLHAVSDEASLAVLKQWQKAHAKLRNQALEELVQEQMIADGKMPEKSQNPDGEWESSVVRAPAAPSELLQTLWYGGQIHWGKGREALAAIQVDPFESAMWDIAARQAAVDLAHFYLGFALLIESALAAV
jgi:hypothetical protein